MKGSKILLIAANAKSRDFLPRALQSETPGLGVEVSGRISEALSKVSREKCDAAVCCVDAPEELAYVIRIKKRNPRIPVVMLTRVHEPGFAALAESMGASAVVRKTAGLEATSRSVALALRTRTLSNQDRTTVARTPELSRELREVARTNRSLVEMALGIAAFDEAEFTTLYVEDDPDQALLLARALSRAKLPPLVRTCDSAEDAIEYLAGRGPYQDRQAYPFPALVISDLKLPGMSGLDLVAWMREREETRLAGVILLTSSDREEDIHEAYRRGTNLYLVKHADMREIVGVVREIFAQFIAQKAGFGSL